MERSPPLDANSRPICEETARPLWNLEVHYCVVTARLFPEQQIPYNEIKTFASKGHGIIQPRYNEEPRPLPLYYSQKTYYTSNQHSTHLRMFYKPVKKIWEIC